MTWPPEPFARARQMEFIRTWRFLTPAYWRGYGPRRAGRRAGALWPLLIVLLWWPQMSNLRGEYLHWTSAEGFHATRTAAWLLWGLGGLLPVLMAFAAGFAWAGTRPLANLLPLSSRQLLVAKLQGRFAAWLLSAVAGLIILAAARGLMVAGRMVETAPSLFDPWLVATLLLFLELFALTGNTAGPDRVERPAAGDSSAAGAFLCALAALAAVLVMRDTIGTHLGAWGFPFGVGLVGLAGVLGMALDAILASSRMLQSAFRRAARTTRPPLAVEEPSWGRLSWVYDGVMEYAWLAVRRLGLTPAQRRARWHWLLLPATAFVLTTGACVLVELGQLIFAPTAETPVPLFPLFVFCALILFLPMTLWDDTVRWGADSTQTRPQRPTRRPHLTALLPLEARWLWRRRFVTLWLAAAVLSPAGMLSHFLCWRLALLGPGGREVVVGPKACWSFPIVTLVAVILFAFFPLLDRAKRTLRLSGTLLWGLATGAFFLGMFLWPLRSPLYYYGQVPSSPIYAVIAGVVAVAAYVGVVILSWLWSDPRKWRGNPDGTRSHTSRRRARIALAMLPLTILLFWWLGAELLVLFP